MACSSSCPLSRCFPSGSAGKESAWNVGDLGLILGMGRSPGEGKGYPRYYSGLRIPWIEYSWRRTVWGHKESDTNEWLLLHFISWSQWCHAYILSSVFPFSSYLQSFPASGSFQMSQFFVLGGQSIGVSSSQSVLPMNIQDWFPLGLIRLISLQSKGLLRVFSNTAVQKHQFFGA